MNAINVQNNECVYGFTLLKDVLILKMHSYGESGSSAKLSTETVQHGDSDPSAEPIKSLFHWFTYSQ